MREGSTEEVNRLTNEEVDRLMNEWHPSGEFACSRCTFLNARHAAKCEICDASLSLPPSGPPPSLSVGKVLELEDAAAAVAIDREKLPVKKRGGEKKKTMARTSGEGKRSDQRMGERLENSHTASLDAVLPKEALILSSSSSLSSSPSSTLTSRAHADPPSPSFAHRERIKVSIDTYLYV